MVLLGLGLPGLQFQAGEPIPGAETQLQPEPGLTTSYEPAQSGEFSPHFLTGGLILVIVLLLILLSASLVKKGDLKRIQQMAGGIVILYILFGLLANFMPRLLSRTLIEAPAAPMPSFIYNTAPIGDPPEILVGCVIAMLLTVVIIVILRLFLSKDRRSASRHLLELEAEAAMQAILSGQNLENVIIQCYLRMENVAQEERGFERKKAETPREFETYLIEKGIPGAPVLQLTRLFEKARYGNQALGKQDEQVAIESLSAIQAACRGLR